MNLLFLYFIIIIIIDLHSVCLCAGKFHWIYHLCLCIIYYSVSFIHFIVWRMRYVMPTHNAILCQDEKKRTKSVELDFLFLSLFHTLPYTTTYSTLITCFEYFHFLKEEKKFYFDFKKKCLYSIQSFCIMKLKNRVHDVNYFKLSFNIEDVWVWLKRN